MSDASAAPNCEGCAALSVVKTDPMSILARLPQNLFERPQVDGGIPGAEFDDVFIGSAEFGVAPPSGQTLEYELARLFAEEKDQFVLGMRHATRLQLGCGKQIVVDGKTVSQCPRATNADLDKVGEQYGLQRPRGFTDCCYWKFLVLMLFKPGPTLWLLREVCELYTGTRPRVIEEPCRLTFVWPGVGDPTHFNYRSYFNRNARFAPTTPAAAPEGPLDSFWFSGPTTVSKASYWSNTPRGAAGMTLRVALNLIKPAGVHVAFENLPRSGRSGCSGATGRGATTRRGLWA